MKFTITRAKQHECEFVISILIICETKPMFWDFPLTHNEGDFLALQLINIYTKKKNFFLQCTTSSHQHSFPFIQSNNIDTKKAGAVVEES